MNQLRITSFAVAAVTASLPASVQAQPQPADSASTVPSSPAEPVALDASSVAPGLESAALKPESSSADGDYVVDAASSTTVESASTSPESPTSDTQEAVALPSSPKASAAESTRPPDIPPRAGKPSTTAEDYQKPPKSEPGVSVSGYAQLQYESHQDSEDQLRQGGTLLNQDRFLARRVRLEFSRRYSFTGYLVEIDGNTTNGPSFGLHRAEGSLFHQGIATKGQPALVELTAGILKLPFGYETPESSRHRWFMERTLTSRALFPNEVDVGVRLHGGWRFLRYGVALTNGEPKGTKATSFQLQDPNHAKDITLRVGAEVRPHEKLQVAGGVSYLAGRGFSAGQDATKSRITWTDSNQNGQVDQGEIVGIPGTAAVEAQNFRRWAVGGDLQVRLRSFLGWTSVFGEAIAAVNLDRGLYIADPIGSSRDSREFGWHIGVSQEITQYSIVGFRLDAYDPDSDLLDNRGGQFLPANQTISTYSPLVGLALPDRARLVFQYDVVRDHLARDKTGVPTDLANNQWTLRLQVVL